MFYTHSIQPERKESLWWLQFVAVVEAKRELVGQDQDAILQLLGYLRLVMVEQKDRRFALGLYISFSQCSVWLQDRSGVLAMDVPIDIHKVRVVRNTSLSLSHSLSGSQVLHSPYHCLGYLACTSPRF